ncbi:hypothetical protein EB061_11155, partial [bacterium]|nr:hypothetical protein [bacterium]
MIQICFSPAYDSTVWAPASLVGLSAVGFKRTGEAGLLDILETRLGLKGPEEPKARRRLAWLAAMKAAGNGFWTRSAAIDPIAASDRLLSVRDRLIEGGWDGVADAGLSKVQDLARIENEFKIKSPCGKSDRLRALCLALESDPKACGLTSVRIECPPSMVSALWGRIFQALKKAGVRVESDESFFRSGPAPGAHSAHPASDSDLFKIQDLYKSPKPPTGDGSVQLIVARDPWESARMVAAWIAAQGVQHASDGRSGTVIICPPAHRGILKTALEARGIPFGGDHAEVSYARPALQILILALTLAWDPKDPSAALALLTIEGSPVSSAFRYALIRSLEESLEIGGKEWQAALATALDRALQESTDPEERKKLEARAKRVQDWFSARAFPLDAGIPASEALSLCERVGAWLQKRPERGASIHETLEILDLLRLMISNLKEASITRERLFHLLVEAVGSGVSSSPHEARANGVRIIDSPAHLIAPAETI